MSEEMQKKIEKNQEENPSKKKKKKGRLSTILLILIFLVGIGIFAYPTFSDWWNSWHASQAIASYVEAVDDLSAREIEEMMKAAKGYNESLPLGTHFTLSDEEYAKYESLLDITGTGIMGYIQIPSISVNLPIYHGTEETVLQIAVGHVTGSSLPVGGESCHTVLSGHRGLPSARLFTDLDQMVEGDIFTITVLGEIFTYRVDQIRIVLPEEINDLAIERGKDYCTLVTCTPYGVNTHRMLVRGIRIENDREAATVTADAKQIATYIVIPAVGVPVLFVLLIVMLIVSRRKPKKSYREILDEVKKS